MNRTWPLLAALAAAWLATGCSSRYWYTAVQAAQHERCERRPSAEDRRRCRAETAPDADRHERERAAARGAARP